MKSNINRRAEIFRGVIPPENSPELEKLTKILDERRKDNPDIEKTTNEYWKKVNFSLEAQYLSNIGLNSEETLRYFLLEFNNRVWTYGLRSMPLMFNIMESYFDYIKPHIYFQLLEEENYLLSFYDFIDFITSKDFDEKPSYIFENITEDIIYNFSLTNFEGITFKGENETNNVITSISLIRRGAEITVLMIVGKELQCGQSLEDIKLNHDTENPDKRLLFKDFQKEVEKQDLKYVFIDENENYVKTLVIARFDIDSMTVDARYVAEENNLAFSLHTDEIDGFLDTAGNFLPDYEEIFKNSLEILKDYEALFEILKFSLYIPYYLNQNEEYISEENHETELGKKYKTPFTRKKFKDTFGDKKYRKDLFILEKREHLQPDRIILRDDLFKIEKSGYWKKLHTEEIGMDKKGNPVHGKTWVNKSLSWFESKSSDVIIQKSENIYKEPNSGFIYIVRNPLHSDNTFKIGLTKKNVSERLYQLSNTSTPDKFYKVQEWNVRDCVKAEKEIHENLKDFRVDLRREFFDIEYSRAVEVINEIVRKINLEIS